MPEKRIFTIPNILSFFRICLIPVIVWQYRAGRNIPAGLLLLLSGATDLIDGPIARRYNMVSDLGKILDPVADKLTQAALLLCLLFRYPLVLIPFILMAAKEIFMLAAGALVIKRTGEVSGAKLHGKAATVLLDAMVLLHVFWHDIPPAASAVAIVICTAAIAISFALYFIQFRRTLKKRR